MVMVFYRYVSHHLLGFAWQPTLILRVEGAHKEPTVTPSYDSITKNSNKNRLLTTQFNKVISCAKYGMLVINFLEENLTMSMLTCGLI